MSNPVAEANTFKTVLRFELRRVLKSKVIWAIAIIMTLKNIFDLGTADWDGLVASGRVARNSAYTAQYFFMYSTFWCAVLGAGLMTMPLLSDLKTRIGPLIYSKPIEYRKYLGAKALASWISLVIVIASLPVAFVLFPYVGPAVGLIDKGALVETPWASMTQATLLWLGLSSIAYGGMHFGLTALTGRGTASYALTAVFIVLFFTYAVSFEDVENNLFLLQATDPVGKQTLDAQVNYWSADMRQRGLIEMTPAFIANRLLLLSVGLGLFIAAFVNFRVERFLKKSHTNRAKRWPFGFRRRESETLGAGGVVWRGAWMKFKYVAITPAFLIVLFMYLMMAIFAAYSGFTFERVETFTGLWTPQLLDLIITGAWLPAIVALVFFATEIVSRDQETRMAALIDAMPTSTAKLVLSNVIALILLALTFVALPGIGAIVSQLPSAGEIRWAVLAEGLFQYGMLTFPVYAGLVYIVWTLSNNRLLTMGLPIIFLIACLIAAETDQLERQIWLVGFVLEAYWSDFDIGRQTNLKAAWHGAVWFSLVLFIAFFATLFSRRGIETDWKTRTALARVRTTPLAIGGLAVLAIAFAYSTQMVLYATTVVNDFHTKDDEYAENAEYEKVFGDWRSKPTPIVTAADLAVTIEPNERRMRYVAAFDLVNYNDDPVESFLINWAEGLKFVAVRGDAFVDTSRGFGGVEDKDRYGHVVIASLSEPMVSGATRRIEVEVAAHYPLYGNGTMLGPIVEDGSTVRPLFLPLIGYDRGRELKEAKRRERFGVGERVRPPKEVIASTGTTAYGAARYVDLTLSVEVNQPQTVAASGDPLSSVRSNDSMQMKTINHGAGSLAVGIVSANFAIAETRLSQRGGVLRVLHHPRHTENIVRMQEGVSEAINRYAEKFGEFPYKTMTIAGAPYHLWAGSHEEADAFAAGNLIVIPEDKAWVHDYNSNWTFDWVKFLTMEKALTVWWGDKRAIADIAGADFLSKAVPSYLALIALDDEEQVAVYEAFQLDEYRREQAKIDGIEYAILDSDGEDYMRAKGLLTLLKIERRIGQDRLLDALTRAYDKASQSPHRLLEAQKVARDIVAASPVEERHYITGLFEASELPVGEGRVADDERDVG